MDDKDTELAHLRGLLKQISDHLRKRESDFKTYSDNMQTKIEEKENHIFYLKGLVMKGMHEQAK